MTSSRSLEPQIDGPESVVIDLDRSVVVWGHDTYPIVQTAENTIGFESADGEKIEGSIDRVSGALAATWKYDSGGPVITFDLKCSPPATQVRRAAEYFVQISCEMLGNQLAAHPQWSISSRGLVTLFAARWHGHYSV